MNPAESVEELVVVTAGSGQREPPRLEHEVGGGLHAACKVGSAKVWNFPHFFNPSLKTSL